MKIFIIKNKSPTLHTMSQTMLRANSTMRLTTPCGSFRHLSRKIRTLHFPKLVNARAVIYIRFAHVAS